VSGDRYPLFLYYYGRQFPNGRGPDVYLLPRQSTQLTVDSVESELAPLAAKHPRLWLASFERALQDPDNLVEQWLEANRIPVLNVAQRYNYLRLYTAGGDAPATGSAYRPQHLIDARLGSRTLVGYDMPTDEYRPGDIVRMALYLRPGTDRTELDAIVVDWVAPDGRVADRRELSIPAVAEKDRAVRLMVSFAVYEYTLPGHYAIEVYPAGKDTDRVRIAAGRVTHSRRLPRCEADRSRDVSLGDGLVRFLGYRVRPVKRVRPAARMTVDLCWQAQRRLVTEYTVFVHLLGRYNPVTGGPVWAQDDSQPMGGGHPTTRWLPGQTVVDRHVLVLPDDIPPGTYAIEVGLYDASTGERLSVSDSDQDRILISEVQITQ
jgi:hypothetical protein